jgi:capsular polysaccharide export protein
LKILAIGYYDDFARFFLAIKKELIKKDANIEFKYLSLYLSGYLYWLLRSRNVSFFSFTVWINAFKNRKKYLNIIDTEKTYKNIDLENVIKYHFLLNEKNGINLKLQALSYIDTIEKLLEKLSPDVIILSGDSRMSIEILNILAKERNIKTYYFEQGPFGTTIFDDKGVNANTSFRKLKISNSLNSNEELEARINAFFSRARSKKYKRSPIYRGSDYLFQFIFSMVGLLPIDIKMEKEIKIISEEYTNLSKNIYKKDKKIFLLILQVPYDVNMVYHSPFYSNHFEILKDVYNNLPENSQLLVREHPLFKGKYEKELFEFMHKNNISLDTNDLYDSIDKADVIVVNNSTVGIEAISRLKSVVVLGNSYYDNDEICLKLKVKDNLSNVLKEALSKEINKAKVLNFFNVFLYQYLIDGHYRDEQLKCTKIISQRIINEF